VTNGRSINGRRILAPPPGVDGVVGQFVVFAVRVGVWVCRAALVLTWRLLAQSGLDVVERLKERRPAVQSSEEIEMRFGAHGCTSDDAACRSERGEGSYAMDREWAAAAVEHLSIDDDGEGADDASEDLIKDEKRRVRWGLHEVEVEYEVVRLTDRVITLRAGIEVDRGVKVVLSYATILKLWTEELFCARAGVEG